MNVDEDAHLKKKTDKQNENLTVSLDAKKSDKGDEESKPRIVLTFRSEKFSAKTSNMKIVSSEEKQEDTPRRSSRTRGKWDWFCDSETSPKKEKSGGQTASENDESDSSYTTPKRSTRRRSKDCDTVLANAIARKEKSYEQPTPTQRLSRRIKPTAKLLANEELRIGLESRSNARRGILSDKAEEGVRTRRSVQPVVTKKTKVVHPEVVEIGTDDDSQSQNTVRKLKHLCELGLKAINTDDADESSNENRDEENETEENETEENETEDDETEENDIDELDEDDEMEDDDPRVISKLLETDEDSDEDFDCPIVTSRNNRPRRSTRLCSSYGLEDSDHSESLPPVEEEQKPTRRSSKRSARSSYYEDNERPYRPKRRRARSSCGEEAQSDAEAENSPAGGEEGSEAACPADETTVVATCYCEATSNFYADPTDLTEPVFCQAIEVVDGVRVGCSHPARDKDGSLRALVRAGPRAPYVLTCAQHAAQLRNHMCCPACGLFCSQGIFYQCSFGHLFHLDCGLPNYEFKLRPGCPHCGVYSYRWQPTNSDCVKVKVEMKCSNKRIFLPDQREQCTPAYPGFPTPDRSTANQDGDLYIPESSVLPSLVDMKRLHRSFMKAKGEKNASRVNSAEELCDAILVGMSAEQLLDKFEWSEVINSKLASQDGGTCAHAAAVSGHIDALYLLQLAGAKLDETDNNLRTPFMVAIMALIDKSKKKIVAKPKETTGEDPMEVKDDTVKVKTEHSDETEDKTELKTEDDAFNVKAEKVMKVVKYLLHTQCGINHQDSSGKTALHMVAEHGDESLCSVLLNTNRVELDLVDGSGWTPLIWATQNQHSDIVGKLLKAGADTTVTDSRGNGAVHWCALSGAFFPLLRLLQYRKQLVHTVNEHTDTPLHLAAREDHYACVFHLLRFNARTDVVNAAGELPVDVSTGHSRAIISINMQMKLDAQGKTPRCRTLSSDISRGREPWPVPCVNSVDDAPLPDDFTYVTRHVMSQQVTIESTIESMQGCECKDGNCASSACACCTLGVRHWYAGRRLQNGFPYNDPPMIFECNETCACSSLDCSNNVVQRATRVGSICVRVEVFRCSGARGWGLRAGQSVPRGAPVLVYCGELLPSASADTRARDRYMFALELKPDLLEQCTYKTQLCVDAAQYGSAARFINHSCAPNLVPVSVFTGARDLRAPTVTFFAMTDIQRGEEFTFNYGDKFWSVKSKWMKCECGKVNCRYAEQSADDTNPCPSQ